MTATFYCSPTGDDNREGISDAAPIRSLQAALDRMNPGDEVKLAPGTYVGAAKYGDAATLNGALAPITITGGPGVLIRGGNKRGHGLTLEGFNGVNIVGIDVGDLPDVGNGTGIWLADVKSALVQDIVVDLPGEWGILTSFVRGGVFTGCVLKRARRQHGIYLGNSTHDVVVSDCHLLGNKFCGIQCNGDARMTSPRGLVATGEIRNVLITDCEFAYNSDGGGADINLDAAVKVQITNCTAFPTRGKGNVITLFHSDYNPSPTSNVRIANCKLVAGADRYNVLRAEDCHDITVTNNTLIHTGYPARADAGLIEIDDTNFGSSGKLKAWTFTNNRFSGAVIIDDAVKLLADLGMTMSGNSAATAADVALPDVADPGAIPAPAPPPPAPVPMPVVLPPLPVDAPVATKADPALVDQGQQGSAWLREWNKSDDRFGDDCDKSALRSLPSVDLYLSILGGTSRTDGFGERFTAFVFSDRDQIVEFQAEGRGGIDVTVAGERLMSGDFYDVQTATKAFKFEKGCYYAVELGVGTVSTYRDRVPTMSLLMRTADDPNAYKQLDPLSVFAPKDRRQPTPAPSPDPTPAPAPAPSPTPSPSDEDFYELMLRIPKSLVSKVVG
jgi:hypothetical protein